MVKRKHEGPGLIKNLRLLLLILACSRNPDSSVENKIYYAYGTDPLPGSLAALTSDFVPKDLSPKVFNQNVPVDIISQRLNWSVDIITQKLRAQSVLNFKLKTQGRPYFEMLIPILVAKLDNQNVSFRKISDPDELGLSYWSIDQIVNAEEDHTLTIEYEMPTEQMSFTEGGWRFLTSMTDVSNAHFFETWGPVGFEDDAFKLDLSIEILNSQSTHRLFANGNVSNTSPGKWEISFPAFFTRSSFYIHLTNSQELMEQEIIYRGLTKDIHIKVYSASPFLIDEALRQLPLLFDEYESDYGPYAHDKFLAYLHAGGGGMEYVGATITSLGALDHELFHCWFARGVMPAEGRSGWIDEALASWRDNGYFQTPQGIERASTNLFHYSPFRKSTPSNSYRDGRALISELDRDFARFGGMKPLMKLFFERYQKRVITNEEFWNFLEIMTGLNLASFYERFSMGQVREVILAPHSSKHPRALMPQEIENLR